ncbi:MAG: hypothetical protein SFU99_10725 [Saprospiraceae bacterium]|nr:hypothetical protein [Saprospiraceae bacterium]
MKNIGRSKALRIISLVFLVCTIVAAGWLYNESNPNMIFKRLAKSVAKEQPQSSFQEIHFAIIHTAQLKKEERAFQEYQDRLQKIDANQLKDKHKTAYALVKQQIKVRLNLLYIMRTDPSFYNLAGQLKIILSNDSLDLDSRLLGIDQLMQDADIYYIKAKDNINYPNPNKTGLAVQKHLHGIKFLNTELLDSLARSSLSTAEKAAITAHTYKAKIAIKDYLAFCRSHLFEHRDSTIKRNNGLLE